MGPHDNEDVLKLRPNVGNERQCSWFLKHDGDDVVTDVTFPRKLLPVLKTVIPD